MWCMCCHNRYNNIRAIGSKCATLRQNKNQRAIRGIIGANNTTNKNDDGIIAKLTTYSNTHAIGGAITTSNYVICC